MPGQWRNLILEGASGLRTGWDFGRAATQSERRRGNRDREPATGRRGEDEPAAVAFVLAHYHCCRTVACDLPAGLSRHVHDGGRVACLAAGALGERAVG